MKNYESLHPAVVGRILVGLLLVSLITVLPFQAVEASDVFTAEASYILGDGETPNIAEQRVIAIASRNALEQAGVYVESISEVKQSQLTRDEVMILTAGVVKTKVLKQYRTLASNGSIEFHVEVSCQVAPTDYKDLVEKSRDKNLLAELTTIKVDYNSVVEENAKLKKLIAANGVGKNDIEKKLKENEVQYKAAELVLSAKNDIVQGDYESGYKNISQAASLDAQYEKALAVVLQIVWDRTRLDKP